MATHLSARSFLTVLAALVVLLACMASPALAQHTWDGGGADDNWSTAANWLDDTAPDNPATDGAFVFTGSTRLNPNADAAWSGVDSITFDSAADEFVLSGQALTFDTTGSIVNNDADTQTITNNLVGGNTLTVNAATGRLILTGTLDLAAATALSVTGDNDTIVSGVISGPGVVIKSGAGTLTVTGDNTFTNGVTLQAGTIAIGSNTALGTGPLIITGGTLQAFGNDRTISNAVTLAGALTIADSAGNDLTLSGAVTLLDDVTLTNENTAGFTLSGAISGAKALTKEGTGTTTLSGVNTYTGITTVNDGTLQLSGGAAIANTGAVVMANTAGAQLELLDSETIGSLSGGGTDGGNVLLHDKTLTLGDNTSKTYEGVISGTGGVIIQGSGTTTWTNDQTFTGDLENTNGTLVVNGTLAGNVLNRAILHASEAIAGNVTNQSGGTINPAGADIGTLPIGGDFTADGSSILQINIDAGLGNTPGVSHDQITVTGSATIANASTISFLVTNPTEVSTTTPYVFLTADGGITITLSEVTVGDNVALLNAVLRLNGDTLGVVFSAENVFSNRAVGANNKAIARGFESLVEHNSANQAVLDAASAVSGIASDATYNTALAERSPAPYFSAFTTNIMAAQTANATISQQLRAAPLAARLASVDTVPALPGAPMFAAAAEDPNVLAAAINQRRRNNDNFLSLDELTPVEDYRPQDLNSVFAAPFTISQSRASEQNFLGYDADTYGVALGVRHPFREDLAAGLVFAYDRTKVEFAENRGKEDVDTVRLGPIASYRPVDQVWFLDGAATYGFHMFDAQRNITQPAAATAEADYAAHDGTLYIDGGADLEYKGWLFTPMASLQYMHFLQDSFKESGAGPAADLSLDSQSFDSLISRLGVTVSYPLDFAAIIFVPEGSFGWQHEFLADNQDVSANFAAGSNSFTVQTGVPKRDALFFGGGVSVLIDDTKSFYVRYDALTDSNGDVHAISGGFVLRF